MVGTKVGFGVGPEHCIPRGDTVTDKLYNIIIYYMHFVLYDFWFSLSLSLSLSLQPSTVVVSVHVCKIVKIKH